MEWSQNDVIMSNLVQDVCGGNELHGHRRDDTGRITLWLLLLDLDSESGSWVTASSLLSRSSPLPHSSLSRAKYGDISRLSRTMCATSKLRCQHLFVYCPLTAEKLPSHANAAFIKRFCLPAAARRVYLTALFPIPRCILSFLLTTLHLDCLYLPRSTAAMISDWCT